MSSKSSASQLTLDLALDPSVSREDLVESPSNALAISMIDAWPDWPGHLVILAGPVGSGKSHIANAWLSKAKGLLLEAEDLAEAEPDLLEKVAGGANVVLENMGPATVDETALFHLLNTVRQEGRYCLVTSRSWPLEWGIALPDLISRLRAAQVVELQEPDDMLLRQVMVKLFADRQLSVDQRIIDFCVLRMERSLASAARLVAAIDEAALANKSAVTRAVAADALMRLGMN